jgi:hypothetical protein
MGRPELEVDQRQAQGWPVGITGRPAVDLLTLRMPLASMSKVTSIWGCPRGMGGIWSSENLPSRLLSRVIVRSPSYTCHRGAGRKRVIVSHAGP